MSSLFALVSTFCLLSQVYCYDGVLPNNIKLTYFRVAGRAHPIRTALYLADIPYDEDILEWDAFVDIRNKDELEWFGLPELTLTFNDNKIVKVGQSIAILTYIGKLSGLYPTHILDSLYVDELLNAAEDLGNVMRPSYKEKDITKKLEMRKDLCQDKTHKGITYWFRKFEAKLKSNIDDNRDSLYFVGDTMTVADLRLYYYFNGIFEGKYEGIDGHKIFSDYPLIVQFLENMNNNKKIAQFRREYDEKYVDKKEL